MQGAKGKNLRVLAPSKPDALARGSEKALKRCRPLWRYSTEMANSVATPFEPSLEEDWQKDRGQKNK